MILRLSHRFKAAFSLFLLMAILTPTLALAADPTFYNDGFKAKWQRADKPVIDGSSNPARSWLWGPEGFAPPGGNTEPYAESPGGSRPVQYFDKARMELNDPANGLVTNGLLVRELISGKLATGNAANITRRPADDIPVGGDPSGNNGPTYASFTKLASLNNDNPASDRNGQPAADTLDKAGNVGTNAELGAKAKYVYFDNGLKHNIPDVFWTFLNQKGNVYVNGALVADQPLLGDNPLAPWLDATGLPITDAYWGKVTVAGVEKDVLIQAFERRVLTYTPTNPAAFQVEMGNVGRHYYSWRYDKKYDAAAPTPTPTPTPVAGCDSLPASTGGAYPFLKCGPAGMVVRAVAPMGASENVTIEVTSPSGSKSTFINTSQPDGNVLMGYATATSSQGRLTIKFTGNKSGKTATTYVFLEKPVDKPTIIVFPDPARLDQDITIVAVGFDAGEAVLIGAEAPDPAAPFLYGFYTASSGGGITTRLILRNIFTGGNAKYLVPGKYAIVATNQSGSHSDVKIITLTN